MFIGIYLNISNRPKMIDLSAYILHLIQQILEKLIQ
jgi:hypothetical protein